MKLKIEILIPICILFVGFMFSQSKTINGKISAIGDVEGIHVLNKNSVKYTVTEKEGSFSIFVKLKDTLVISGLKYNLKEIVIDDVKFNAQLLIVKLTEKVNQLDEVIVGRLLTGSLNSDVNNTKTKEEVNFYNLGIPGYIGKPKTIEERKLYDADHGKMAAFYGIAGAVNINKLLNKISGRTKKLKAIVALSEKDKCMKRLKRDYTLVLFENKKFKESQVADYFYFCLDDPNFKAICDTKNPMETIPFLRAKLKTYKQNLNSKTD